MNKVRTQCPDPVKAALNLRNDPGKPEYVEAAIACLLILGTKHARALSVLQDLEFTG